MAALKALLFALLFVGLQGSISASKNVLNQPVPSEASAAIKSTCEQQRTALKNAVEAGKITQDQAEDVFSDSLAAAKKNGVTTFTKVDLYFARNVDSPTRKKIFINAIQKNLHKNNSSDVKTAIREAVGYAELSGLITEKQADKLKADAPSVVPVGSIPYRP